MPYTVYIRIRIGRMFCCFKRANIERQASGNESDESDRRQSESNFAPLATPAPIDN